MKPLKLGLHSVEKIFCWWQREYQEVKEDLAVLKEHLKTRDMLFLLLHAHKRLTWASIHFLGYGWYYHL